MTSRLLTGESGTDKELLARAIHYGSGRADRFHDADGGTLFLDEIGETSPGFQVKLLRVLEEGEIRPLGSNRCQQVDVRVIAATNRDLKDEVAAGRFREDFYYRLATVPLHVPPLRERPMDIPLLAEGILRRAAQRLGRPVDGFAPEVLACLEANPWPGNVRELMNEIQRMLSLSDGPILDAGLLSPQIRLAGLTQTNRRDPGHRRAQGRSGLP